MSDFPIFKYFAPKEPFIGIVSIPHSGEFIPEEFKPFLTDNLKALACDVDFKVDELVDIEKLNKAGIAVIVSTIHRTCVDLNRPEQSAVLNWKSNSKGEKLVVAEPDAKLKSLFESKYHIPYFEMLKTMIHELKKKVKLPISFIDLHSMPSKPTEYHLKITPNQPLVRPDFCVSDIEGLSCSKQFIDSICKELEGFSSNVTQNIPYYGGHITRYINETYTDINNIQIEISRAIYMDEEDKVLIDDLVNPLKKNLTQSLISFFQTNL